MSRPFKLVSATSLCSALLALALLCVCSAVSAAITTESESNNTQSRANGPIGSDITVSGSLSTKQDIDWFYFDLATAGTLGISLSHSSGRDFDWALYGSTGSALATGNSSAIPDIGSYNATATGRYFLKITAYRGSGSYTLNVSAGGGGGGRPAKPSNLQTWLTGNAADAGRAPVNGPALLLMGGNFDIDEAFTLRAFPIANGGDVVVLRTSGSNGYNDYLYNLTSGSLKPDSVETLLVDTRTKADTAFVDWVLRNAELIYIAGGDQSAYVNAWKGTNVESAIQAAYARGAVIGGISAGLAVQGEFVYDPDGVTAVTSAEALANPYRNSMLFTNDFLDLPLMQDIITDTHFRQRDRMGRLLAFMARLRQDGLSARIVGVGVDEDTSLFIDSQGRAIVDGDFAAYVIQERSDTTRTQVSSGQPLIYRNLQRVRLLAGQTFDFASGSHTGNSAVISVDGRNSAPFTPADPY